MSKEIDHTYDSLEKSLELAEAIHKIAPCSAESAAKKLERKDGGSFRNLIASAKKFGLIDVMDKKYLTTTLYKKIREADDGEEKQIFLKQSFLNAKLYRELYDRFKVEGYPADTIRVILFGEYKIKENLTSKISFIFKKGAMLCGLLNSDSSFNDFEVSNEDKQDNVIVQLAATNSINRKKITESVYSVTIVGPTGNLVGPAEISDLDQLMFVKTSITAALELIEKKIKERISDENL